MLPLSLFSTSCDLCLVPHCVTGHTCFIQLSITDWHTIRARLTHRPTLVMSFPSHWSKSQSHPGPLSQLISFFFWTLPCRWHCFFYLHTLERNKKGHQVDLTSHYCVLSHSRQSRQTLLSVSVHRLIERSSEKEPACTSTSHYAHVRTWVVSLLVKNNRGMTLLVCFCRAVKCIGAGGNKAAAGWSEERGKSTSRAWLHMLSRAGSVQVWDWQPAEDTSSVSEIRPSHGHICALFMSQFV